MLACHAQSALLGGSTAKAKCLHQLGFFRGMPGIMQVVCKFGVPVCHAVQVTWSGGVYAKALAPSVHSLGEGAGVGSPSKACLPCCRLERRQLGSRQ